MKNVLEAICEPVGGLVAVGAYLWVWRRLFGGYGIIKPIQRRLAAVRWASMERFDP